MLHENLNKNGISDARWVFETGMRIGDETVRRTFQPSFTVTPEGVLYAFCQGRVKDARDDDPKVILMNRSDDGGDTWQGPRAITAPLNHFALSAYVRPGRNRETVSVLTCVGMKVTKDYYGHDAARILDKTGIDVRELGDGVASVLCRYDSTDGGTTWRVMPYTGANTPLGKVYGGFTPVFFNAIGQVHVMDQGPHAGRYLIGGPVYAAAEGETPTNHFRNHPCVGSGVIYSDDSGVTWEMAGFAGDYLANECSVVSTGDGDELLMIRRVNPENRFEAHPPRTEFRPSDEERIAHFSPDCGRAWSEPFGVRMSAITCHGTLTRVGTRLYFSVPAGKTAEGLWTRQGGTIYYSDDRGKTWKGKCVESGNFSYSTVGRLNDVARIVFYGGTRDDKGLSYRIFTDEWLEKDHHDQL